MDPLLSTLILVLLALLGARLTFSTESIPPGPRLLFRTGTHFLAVGIVLGPAVLGVVGEAALPGFTPLLALGLGWIGILFGLQLDREHLKEFPPGFPLLAVGQGVVTLLLFYAVGRLGLEWAGLHDRVSDVMLWAAAATASISTPAGVAMVSANFLARGSLRQLLFYVASVDAVVGIAALGVVVALRRPGPGGLELAGAGGAEWVAATLGLGLVTGIVLIWLTRNRPSRDELVLYLLGISALASGVALRLELSPLLVSVLAGAVVANVSAERHRIFAALHRWEKPVYVVFLLLAGALMRYPTHWVLPLAALYVGVRLLGKWAGGAAMARVTPLPFRPPAHLGLGLVPQGGISLAVAVSWMLLYPELRIAGVDGGAVVFDVVVLGVVASELFGPPLTASLLRRQGEIQPQVEEALEAGDTERAQEEAIRRPASTEGGAGERESGPGAP